MRLRFYLVWGGLCYLLFLAANMPAAWLYARLPTADLPVHLVAISGEPWSADVEKIGFDAFHLGPVHWQLRWGELLLGRLELDVRFGDRVGPTGEARVGVSLFGTASAQGVKADFRLLDLRPLAPMWPTGTKGRVRMNVDEITVSEEGVQSLRSGKTVSTLSGFHIGFPINLTLGDLEITPKPGESGGLRLRIQDRNGPVRMNIRIDLAMDGQYHIHGLLAAKDPLDRRLTGMLETVGQRNAEGNIIMDQIGRFF